MKKKSVSHSMGAFYALWATQSLSSLGSAMTGYALIVWSYTQEGSALTTALLTICSYAPYVALSLFAGALSDRWDKKRTMLLCDSFAAVTTVAVLLLLYSGRLALWHIYLVNLLSGAMNTLQQPASEVAVSVLAPAEQYQRVGGLRSLSNSLVTMLSPVLATAFYGWGGLGAVILFDLGTFAAAFLTLALFIRIPPVPRTDAPEPVLTASKAGLWYLWNHRGILDLMLFLAAINLTYAMYQTALPALLLSRPNGGESVLALVNACCGAANLMGSVAVSLLPRPRSRVRVICNCLLLAMSTENMLLALGRGPGLWCLGAVIAWLGIPVMNANMEALLRSTIPVELQGRVYAARNTLQFFTIPLGSLLSGVLIDRVLEPFMARQGETGLLAALFGTGKGSGAALLFLALAVLGVVTCLIFRRDRQIWALED